LQPEEHTYKKDLINILKYTKNIYSGRPTPCWDVHKIAPLFYATIYGFQKFTFDTLLIPTYRQDNTALKTGSYYRPNIGFFPVALRPNADHGLLILEASRSHTPTHHSW